MNYFDTLYRALADYRKNTANQTECKVQRSAITVADSEKDRIEVTRKNCIVETDWLDEIEGKLEFIEKAIKEERQFIRTQGEVEPIEKVKRVSKDSVEHLARHSNYFTREPEEGQDMIPDQLYVVERLSDYAVYENRFLYMLLCYLRDFVGMRYEKILELTNTYNGVMSMEKDVIEVNRKIKVHIHLEEERANDEYLRAHNIAQRELDRMRVLHQAILAFLKTPLMIEVAKTPMLKPPITRTNVLKMNRNFREALKLYEYVAAYNHDGYTIHTEKNTLTPFVGVAGEEIADMVDGTLFLGYEYGLGIRDYFRERYVEEENRRREEEIAKRAERIRNIERHITNEGLTPTQYIELLEERIHDLEKEEDELAIAKKELTNIQASLEATYAELERAHDTARLLGDEITRLNAQFAADMEAAQETFKARIDELTMAHKDAMTALNEEHQEEIDSLNEEHAGEINALNEEHAQEVEDLTAKAKAAEEEHLLAMQEAREEFTNTVQSLKDKYTAEADALYARIDDGVAKLTTLQENYTALEEQRLLADARLTALRKEHGLITPTDDFTSKEAIDELENEFYVFKKFFKQEWRKTQWKLIKEMFVSVFGKKAREEDKARKETEKREKEIAKEQMQATLAPTQETVNEQATPVPTQETANEQAQTASENTEAKAAVSQSPVAEEKTKKNWFENAKEKASGLFALAKDKTKGLLKKKDEKATQTAVKEENTALAQEKTAEQEVAVSQERAKESTNEAQPVMEAEVKNDTGIKNEKE